MSKMTDDLAYWLSQYRSGRLWLSNLKSKETIRVYLPNFKVYCDAVNKTPDELIQLKIEGLKHVGEPNEFQAEELHDLTLSAMDTTPSVKVNISASVNSFYKHNRRNLIEVTKFDAPEPKERCPTLEDVQDLANCTRNRRDEALIWFLSTAPFRLGTLRKLKWRDLEPIPDKDFTYQIKIESKRLKGKGRGKYKGLKQICFVNKFVAQKLVDYRKEARRKGYTFTEDSPLFIGYKNGGRLGASLSKPRINDMFTKASLDAWSDLENKRFSPHDMRSFVQTAMEEARVADNWRSVILGHKVKGVDAHYSAPEIEKLKEQFRATLEFIVPLHKQFEAKELKEKVKQVDKLQQQLNSYENAQRVITEHLKATARKLGLPEPNFDPTKKSFPRELTKEEAEEEAEH